MPKVFFDIRFAISLIICCIGIDGYGWNVNMFIPRNGDVCNRTFVNIDNVLCDTANNIIDLSKTKSIGTETVKYYAPSPNDSLNHLMMVTSSRDIFEMVSTGSSYLITKHSKPGQWIKYDKYMPEIVLCDSCASFCGKGLKNTFERISVSGTWKSSVRPSWQVITASGDSIDEAYSVLTMISEFVNIENVDTIPAFECNTIRQLWFVNGCRYPVIDYSKSVAVSAGEVIDKYEYCSVYDVDKQKDEITDDYENENIRDSSMRKGVSRQKTKHISDKNSGLKKETHFITVKADAEAKNVTIFIDNENGHDFTINLCDASGKTLFTKRCKQSENVCSFNMNKYSAGEYFIYVTNGQISDVSRFILQ